MGWNDIMFDKNGIAVPIKKHVIDDKPYSNADEKEAKFLGLNLDDWQDYKEYYCLEEYADKEC